MRKPKVFFTERESFGTLDIAKAEKGGMYDAKWKNNEKRGKVKKVILVVCAVLIALSIAQLLILGIRGGIGPLGFIYENKIAKLPGNAQEYDFSSVEPLEDSPLKGKTVLFLGSSVTDGTGSLHTAMPEYFAQRTGCTVIKEAVKGTTLVDNGRLSYVQRLKENVDPAAKVDLVICQLSTNDASTNKPLGEIAEGTSGFDTKTITGAMEEIIAYSKATWDCPVFFYTGSYYDSENYAAMVERLFEVADKWEISVLDLWHDEEFNSISEEQRALYMKDDIHPTKAGYRDWWCPELEKQLFEFLQGN